MIMGKTETFIGISLEYCPEIDISKSITLNEKTFLQDDVNVGFIGAGSLLKTLLPSLRKSNKECSN